MERREELQARERVDGVIDKWRSERNGQQAVVVQDGGVELPPYEVRTVVAAARMRST